MIDKNIVRLGCAVQPVRSLLKGTSQVMLQGNAWTGLLFLLGIFLGAYQEGMPVVAWGAVVGLLSATWAGYLLPEPISEGEEGLWGFNGILVGCALPTFLGNRPEMWVALVLCSASTCWLRTGLNRMLKPWKINSLTLPFILLTWIYVAASFRFSGMATEEVATSTASQSVVSLSFSSLWVYWLKGIGQVFLLNSWMAGLCFLVGLLISNRHAAMWAALGSVIGIVIAWLYGAPETDIAEGLYGFSPVLTAIALGSVFYPMNRKSFIWAILATVTTVFIQASLDALLAPLSLHTLTMPFCLATWLFLLPMYKFGPTEADHTHWHLPKWREKKDVLSTKL